MRPGSTLLRLGLLAGLMFVARAVVREHRAIEPRRLAPPPPKRGRSKPATSRSRAPTA
jgi:hypothetical protein